MPWDESYFPRSMVNLAPAVRTKAIEIANALLEEGCDEGSCDPYRDFAGQALARGDSR